MAKSKKQQQINDVEFTEGLGLSKKARKKAAREQRKNG